MRKFKHLTKTKRLQLESFLIAKMTVKQIASLLNVHISTIYREIKRGLYEHKTKKYDKYSFFTGYKTEKRYSSDIAHQKYIFNLQLRGPDLKIGNDHEFADYLEKRIVDDKLSPSAVLGEIKKKQLQFKTSISINTLYSYIDKGVFARLTRSDLTFKTRKKQRKKVVIKKFPRGKSIEQRPLEVLQRNTFGHWEMDCVCGSTRSVLLVLTERLTRKEIIMPMKNQKSESVIRCLNSIEKRYGKDFKKIFKTITVDNGCEFSNSVALERSIYGKSKRTDVFYCHPYCSSERGSNERLNREIRRLIPKGSDLSKYTKQQIQRVEDWVNNYPRRIFGYSTSAELFNSYVANL